MATTSPDNIWTPDAGDAYALTTDLAAMADTVQDALTDLRGDNRYFQGTNANRLLHTAVAGDIWYATDTNLEWTASGPSTWFVSRARIRGRVNRSATATTFPASYTNVATNTFWTANVAQGLSAYSNGWTAPIAGRYLISYEMRATGAFLSGVTVNYSGASPTLILASSPNAVQGIAATTVAAPVLLAANDVIRPYLLAGAGTPSWVDSTGFFSIEWVGND